MNARPTPEQIAEARKWLDASKLREIEKARPISADMIRVLLAATEPPTCACSQCPVKP